MRAFLLYAPLVAADDCDPNRDTAGHKCNILAGFPDTKIAVSSTSKIHAGRTQNHLVDGLKANSSGFWHSGFEGDGSTWPTSISRCSVTFTLDGKYYIDQVRIKNRCDDSDGERLTGAKVELITEGARGTNNDIKEQAIDKAELCQEVKIDFKPTLQPPTKLRISQDKTSGLNIIEVEARGLLACPRDEEVKTEEFVNCTCAAENFGTTIHGGQTRETTLCKLHETCLEGKCTGVCTEPLEKKCKECRPDGKSYTCASCKDGFQGNKCEINLCDTEGRNCKDGHCHGLPNSFECTKCDVEHTGHQCKTKICEESGKRCESCWGIGHGIYTCGGHCKDGYRGGRCEDDLCIVMGNNCKEDACERLPGDIKCTQCKPGFNGTKCGTDICAVYGKNCNECTGLDNDFQCKGCIGSFNGTRCDVDLCENCEGACNNTNNVYSCPGGCKNGFKGDTCQIDICATEGVNCKECNAEKESFKCNGCVRGFLGDQCSIKISDELQEALDNPPFVIVGAAASLAFVILLLFLTAWDGSHASLWCRTFSERRSPSQYTAHSAQSRNSRVSQISRLSQPVSAYSGSV